MVDDNLTDNSYLYESSVAAIDFVSDKYEVYSTINSRSTPDPPFLDAFLASRERCFCVSISFLNSFESNRKPASSAMSSVKLYVDRRLGYRRIHSLSFFQYNLVEHSYERVQLVAENSNYFPDDVFVNKNFQKKTHTVLVGNNPLVPVDLQPPFCDAEMMNFIRPSELEVCASS